MPTYNKLVNDYLELMNGLGRRPTYLELHLKGHSDSAHYKHEFNSYVGFLSWAD
jgi:hypothetical protein